MALRSTPRLMTRSGWAVLIGSATSILAARLLGSVELFLLGVIGIGLCVVAITVVRTRRLAVEVSRSVEPARVHAGSASQVTLTVVNRGTGRTPVLRVQDPVSGTRGANLLVAPLVPGVPARAAYRLPTERRGIIEVGPMRVTVTDPFGLCSSTIPAAGVTHLTVYPPVHRLSSLPSTGGADPHSGLEHHRALTRGGENFYALRPFVVGDELRRVHWPSSARHDELLVRQDELPWQGRMTVLVDNTAGRLRPAGLDLAATIAASVLSAAHHRGNLVRLIFADGTDSGFLAGNAQLEALMELLAVVDLDQKAALRTAVDHAGTNVRNGAIVAITGELDTNGQVLLSRLQRAFGTVCSVTIDPSAYDPTAPEGAAAASRRFIRVTRSAPFPDVWVHAMNISYAAAPA
jgi:uncharacterized protein (DUF58 family)